MGSIAEDKPYQSYTEASLESADASLFTEDVQGLGGSFQRVGSRKPTDLQEYGRGRQYHQQMTQEASAITTG